MILFQVFNYGLGATDITTDADSGITTDSGDQITD